MIASEPATSAQLGGHFLKHVDNVQKGDGALNVPRRGRPPARSHNSELWNIGDAVYIPGSDSSGGVQSLGILVGRSEGKG